MTTKYDLELSALSNQLHTRAGGSCELCSSTRELAPYAVPPVAIIDLEHCALLCQGCREQIEQPHTLNQNHWLCLNDSAWSTVPALQALALRILTLLSHLSWARDLSEQLYIEDDVRSWANAGLGQNDVITLDAHGAALQKGDSVTLIKDLDVKGTNFVAKRGTVIKGIGLTEDGTHIEGKVQGTAIYIIATFVKKN